MENRTLFPLITLHSLSDLFTYDGLSCSSRYAQSNSEIVLVATAFAYRKRFDHIKLQQVSGEI